jgi:hypothetical protein
MFRVPGMYRVPWLRGLGSQQSSVGGVNRSHPHCTVIWRNSMEWYDDQGEIRRCDWLAEITRVFVRALSEFLGTVMGWGFLNHSQRCLGISP